MRTTMPNNLPSDLEVRRHTVWWLLGLMVVLFLGVGLRYPWPADEPRFAQIAREMVESGQWLFPTRGGEFYPDKPPVFMWISAALYALIGHIKVSFLLPSTLAAIGTLLLVRDLALRLWGGRVAFWAVLILAFTPQFLLQGKAAQIDALVTFWITLGCYGLVRHFITGPHWGWYFVSWVAMGLGIMTKGVGFLPLLMLLPLAIWVRNPAAVSEEDKVWRWRALAGLLVLLLTVACWLGPMLWQVHAQGTADLLAYRNNILFRQTAERYANAWGHIKPWHYFLTQAMPLVWFPLPFVLLALFKPLASLWRADARLRVLLVWVGLVVLFFSLSKGKREVYIFPALPMLALVVAVLWDSARASRGARVLSVVLPWVLGLAAVAIAALGAVIQWAPHKLSARLQEYGDLLDTLGLPLVGLGVVLLVMLVLFRRRDLFVRLAINSMAIWVFVSLVAWPRVDPHRTPQQIMADVESHLPAGAELGLIQFKEQFLLFSQRRLTHFSYLSPLKEQERRAWQWVHEAPNRFVLVPTDAELTCFDFSHAVTLGEAHRREWVLLGTEALHETCPAPTKDKRFVYVPRTEGVLP
ncbi:MAG: glycosyltransferase family 39 protein [Burkholderiaceae bacterium]